MKFAHRYKLLKPIPGHAAGEELAWNGNSRFFYFWAKKESERELRQLDMDAPRFTVEQIQDAEWFEPLSPLKDFIPAFPPLDEIAEFMHMLPECRMVNDVDECRAINAMLDSPGFQIKLYEFYRDSYNAFHGLTPQLVDDDIPY